MTVDMLAATFFWPEGRLLGPHDPHSAAEKPAAVDTGEIHANDDTASVEGFWPAVMRYLRGPSSVMPTATVP